MTQTVVACPHCGETLRAKRSLATQADQAVENATRRRERRQRMETIAGAVATFYDVTLESLVSHKQRRSLALARHVAMYLMYHAERKSKLRQIGWVLGGRNHSTIGYGIDRVARERRTNEQLRGELGILEAALGIAA